LKALLAFYRNRVGGAGSTGTWSRETALRTYRGGVYGKSTAVVLTLTPVGRSCSSYPGPGTRATGASHPVTVEFE